MRGEVGPHKDVEADPHQLVEGEQAIFLISVQGLAQLHSPLLPVLLARVDNILGRKKQTEIEYIIDSRLEIVFLLSW